MESTQNRLHKLSQQLEKKGLQALWVSQPENLFYLSGCEGLEGYLLITAQKVVMATDFRYVEQAERQSPECEVCRISGKMAQWLPDLLATLNPGKLGFESSHLNVASYDQLRQIIQKNKPELELEPVEGLVESIRMVKDDGEIDCIQKAAKITDAVLGNVENMFRLGMTEKQLAWEIEKYMREHGSQPVPFELIVAAGPNSALPHARPSDHVIQEGEPVVIDIGSKYQNYGSDLTRTFCFGKPGDTFKKVYDTVLKAQLAAISGITAGMTGQEADAVARRVIEAAGHGEAFGHSLGHGIGLVTHEQPRVGPNSPDILEDGMVFTIEPGIYISGWGGVRIEDDVAVAKGKLRVISSAKK